jgi:hypothetical protein
MKKWDILIGMPCYDRKLYVDTATSLTNTVVELISLNARAAIFTLSGCALITHARNAIVSEFLSRKEKTHLLFVDSDMEWMPNTVLRMLRANVPFAAAPYVQKKYNNALTKTYNVKDLDSFHAAAMDWNVELENVDILRGERKLSGVVNGFVRVPRIGAGLMLLRRDMLEAMILKYADTQYQWDTRAGNFVSSRTRHFGLFDLLKEEAGSFIGEDYAFCDRWVKGCGGEIWCDIEAKIGHHGHHRYSSSLNESVRIRSRTSG